MSWLDKTLDLLGESVLTEEVVTYYHGTATPKGVPFESFKKSKGARSSMIGVREVEVDWTFFTDSKELAMKFAKAKVDFFEDKGIKTKPIVMSVSINLSSMKVLDLESDDYEFELEDIADELAPHNYYGIGNYFQTQMWEYLDDEHASDIIVKSGVKAVKLQEPNMSNDYIDDATEAHSAQGSSIAIHHTALNTITIKE